jgi:ABC-type cobalamin/Fe3+-siderophores transport system ATPase subunit
MLNEDNVSCLRGERRLITALSFMMQRGRLLAVTGENGSGKTSLLRMLYSLLPAEQGRILWHGETKPLAEDSVAEARLKQLAVYRQQFAELEQDRKNGMLNDGLHQQARRELERRLLDETGSADTTPTAARWQVSS